MPKKAILNVTSRKKRNGMLSWSNTDNTGATQSVRAGTAYVRGNSAPGTFLWLATAQDMVAGVSGPDGTVTQEAQRTATTCFMRGLSEHLRIQTSSGLPWFHRRICFTTKGDSFSVTSPSDTPTQNIGNFIDTSQGMERLWFNGQINNQANTNNQRLSILFKGAQGVDWDDQILAPVDTARVTLKFDKTWCIKSGNANGTVVERKLWHPMNHNLRYDDDESGVTEPSSYYSTDSKIGMGDYFVFDIIQAGIGGTASDLLNIYSNSTLYWHEK